MKRGVEVLLPENSSKYQKIAEEETKAPLEDVFIDPHFAALLKQNPNAALAIALEKKSLPDAVLAQQAGANIHHPLKMALKNDIVAAKILITLGAALSVDDDSLLFLGKSINTTIMKLFAAQTKKNKAYPFIETVIDQNQLDDYLRILQSSKKPLDEKVSIRNGVHWYGAQIRIDDNEVKLLILDSNGYNESMESDPLPLKIKEFFPHHACSVQVDSNRLQTDGHSCAFFTLYAMKDLHKIGVDIFAYGERKKYSSKMVSNILFNYSRLPLRMMRPTQSRRQWEAILAERTPEEVSLPINKKGQTAIESVVFSLEDGRNHRIKLKFIKTLNSTCRYIEQTPMEEMHEIQATMEEFDLVGLKKRLS